jgi:hypothetical protein
MLMNFFKKLQLFIFSCRTFVEQFLLSIKTRTMSTKTSMEISPMVYPLGNNGTLMSFTGAAEVLIEMENCKDEADMVEALNRVKVNYEDLVAELPQLLEYDAQDKLKIQNTFWVLNQVRKFLGGVQVLKAS